MFDVKDVALDRLPFRTENHLPLNRYYVSTLVLRNEPFEGGMSSDSSGLFQRTLENMKS